MTVFTLPELEAQYEAAIVAGNETACERILADIQLVEESIQHDSKDRAPILMKKCRDSERAAANMAQLIYA